MDRRVPSRERRAWASAAAWKALSIPRDEDGVGRLVGSSDGRSGGGRFDVVQSLHLPRDRRHFGRDVLTEALESRLDPLNLGGAFFAVARIGAVDG